MAAYAQFGPPGYHTPPTQFFSRSGLQVPPSLTTQVLSSGRSLDGGTQSPIATSLSAPSTSPPLTIGRTDSGGGGIGGISGGCSSGNNSNSSGGTTTIEGGSSTPELISQSTTTATNMSNSNNNNNNDATACHNKSVLSTSVTDVAPPPPPTESSNSIAYPYQSCNTSISTAPLQPTVSCCDNGRPVMTDPVSGQMICSCQYDPTRFTTLSNYTRIQSAAGIGVYGTPYPSNEQNPYPSIGIESPPFYSSVTHPYALKDSTGTSDVTSWTSGGLQSSASYYTYDPTFGAYGYGASYDLASRRKNATRESTATLKAWLNEHKKNPYPTKGEKIMLAIITKMTLTQVSTWFANARRRLKKENKMTWEPKNRTEDDDDALVSDEEKDHEDGEVATKQSIYNYDGKTSLPNGAGTVGGGGADTGNNSGRISNAGAASISCTSDENVTGSGCVGNNAISLSKYNTGPGSGDTVTAVAPTNPDVAGVMTSLQQKECYGLPYALRDEHALDPQMAALPLYQRMCSYQQDSYQALTQPMNGTWRAATAASQYTPYMDWTRLHAQRGETPHSPSGTSVVATISLQSTATSLEMRPAGYSVTFPAISSNVYPMPANEDACIKREPSNTPTCPNLPAVSYTNTNEKNESDILRKGLYCT